MDNNIVPTNPNHGKKWRFLAFVIGGLVCLGVAIFVVVFCFVVKRQDVYILVAPVSAEIEIEGKKYVNGQYSLPVGEHHIIISADGFSYDEYDFTLTSEEPKMIYTYLNERTKSYTEEDYEVLSLVADDDYTEELITRRLHAKTIFEHLPIKDDEAKITVTDGTDNDDCEEGSMCIMITGTGTETEESALDVIRKNGYDPNDYECFYDGIIIEEDEDSNDA